MNPAEREVNLKKLSDTLENGLTEAFGKRINFVLVMLEVDDNDRPKYVSHITNTPKELAKIMTQACFGREYKEPGT